MKHRLYSVGRKIFQVCAAGVRVAVSRRTLLKSVLPLAAAVLSGCRGVTPNSRREPTRQESPGATCWHTAILHLELVSATSEDSPVETESDVVHLDSESLSERQRAILSDAISEQYGFDTCVDEETPPELAELVRTIFDSDEELRHYSSDAVILQHTGNYYRARYRVSVK